jgi:general secretion pathway protein A
MRISPFTLSPNPAWMYLTPSTLGSIETIRWMVEDRQGLAAIFGDAGYGKSTLLRLLLSEYADESLYTTTLLTRVDFSTAYAFAKKISADFGIEAKRSLAAQNDALEEFLIGEYQAGRTVIVFLDEGQRLNAELLEVIRGLLNFESDVHKLVQIVVAGQLDLLDRIKAKRNKALASRIFSPVMIQQLSESEAGEMVQFRCSRARVPCPFTDEAITQIYRHVGGNPRAILWTCARAAKQFQDGKILPEHIDLTLERAPRVQAAATDGEQ